MGIVQFLLSNKCSQWLSMTIPIVSHNFKITVNYNVSSYKRYTYLGFLFCISIYILSFFIPFNNKKCKYHLAVFDNYTIRSHCPRQLSWTPKARAVKFICMYLVKGFMDITIKLISHYFENSFLRFQLFLLYGHNDNVLELELLTLGQ